MKVLCFSTWNEPCGIAGYSANLLQALGQLGVTTEVHAVNAKERKYFTRAEVRRDLDEFCARAEAADLVHIQHEFSFFDSFDLKRSVTTFESVLGRLSRSGKPVVVTFHTHPPFRRSLVDLVDQRHGGLPAYMRQLLLLRNMLLNRRWRQSIGRFFRGGGRYQAVVHTRTTRRVLIEEGRFAPDHIDVLPMGVVERSGALHEIDPATAKAALGYPPGTKLASIFGFIQPFKGYETALRALARLPKHWHLAIVGGPHPESRSDKTLDTIIRLRSLLRLGDRVRVTGFADFETLDQYHAATDVCLAPYQRGDLISGSVGITWALSSGKPVIASDIPVFKELQEASDGLLLFAETAQYDLAWQMERVMNDCALRQKLVKNATTYAAGHLWPNVAQTMLDIYTRTLQRR